jgi:hypothetical protein
MTVPAATPITQISAANTLCVRCDIQWSLVGRLDLEPAIAVRLISPMFSKAELDIRFTFLSSAAPRCA